MRVDLENFHNAKFLSVSALNRYINYKFDSDIHLQEVYAEKSQILKLVEDMLIFH